MSGGVEDLFGLFQSLRKQLNDQERNIYIVAGVLGAVDLALIIGVIGIMYIIFQTKKQIQNSERQRKIEEEMNAQKFSAYTGEEMHRKLMASTPTPLTAKPQGGSDSEYAFNAPYVENRLAANTTQSKFNRF